MAHFNDHCRDCERMLGDKHENVNHWMDELFRTQDQSTVAIVTAGMECAKRGSCSDWKARRQRLSISCVTAAAYQISGRMTRRH
jgi:hypothetical protein